MKEITLEEALKLVRFKYSDYIGWQVCDVPSLVHGDVLGVKGNVFNDVGGNIYGKVGGDKGIRGNVEGCIGGNVYGDVDGNIYGKVGGNVKGRINGRVWRFVETPKDKLQRLIVESGNQELIEAFNQLEDS